MRRLAQTALLALIGAGLLHTALFTDLYLRYVKEGLRPVLIASGVVLLLLAAVNAYLDLRRPEPPDRGTRTPTSTATTTPPRPGSPGSSPSPP